MQVLVSPRALDQLTQLVAWWRSHRPSVRDHLEEEFERALAVLAEYPHLGRRYGRDRRYRLHQLKKTPYVLFYVVDEEANEVQVDAVWSTMHREGPDLG